MLKESRDVTSSAAFFEAKYRNNADPWNFACNTYELSRYDAIIAAISHQRYRQAYEPGCSIGVLTELLANHCNAVYAIDFSPTAAAQAKTRCSHLPQVEVHCGSIVDGLPSKEFDLLVLSEIGYYFTRQEWQQLSAVLVESIPQNATVLAAHWLGFSKDHRISGDEVHEILLSHPSLQMEYAERYQARRLDRLVRL